MPADHDAGRIVVVGDAAQLGSSVPMAGFERPRDVLTGEYELAVDVHFVGGDLSSGVESPRPADRRDVEGAWKVGNVDGNEARVRRAGQLASGPQRAERGW